MHGIVHLRVCLERARVAWALPIDMDNPDGIFVKQSMLGTWTCSSLREPVISDGVRWDSGVVPLDQPSPRAVKTSGVIRAARSSRSAWSRMVQGYRNKIE